MKIIIKFVQIECIIIIVIMSWINNKNNNKMLDEKMNEMFDLKVCVIENVELKINNMIYNCMIE